MNNLIDRLEAGSGADRELNALINFHVDKFDDTTPNYTGSLDACIALAQRVLPRCEWELHTNGLKFYAGVNDVAVGRHVEPCRAFLLALIRAKEAGDGL